MTKKKTNPKEECQGRYYVKGYETDDGKKVEGYYRTCWKHGANGSSAQETDPEEDGTHYPKNIPTKGIDELGIPLLGQNTPTEENSHPVWDIIGTVIGMAPEIFLKYME